MKESLYRRQHLSPQRWAPQVLLIVFNPVLEAFGGPGLWQHMRWNDPTALVQATINDLAECSDGRLQYRIVERVELDIHPTKIDGFHYDDRSLLDVLRRPSRAHRPDTLDYLRLVNDFDLAARVESGGVDEVWLMGYPYAGFWESTMAGQGAFFCNAPPVQGTERCRRRFVIMGFNYERGVGEMLEDFGHRAESILTYVFRNHSADTHLWRQFCQYDQKAPRDAAVGTIHFAPNSVRDYDWGNPRPVPSTCDNWLDFPALSGDRRQVTCEEWGGGDIRAHHRWWLKHLPCVTGEAHGVANDWWGYVVDPNTVR